MRSTRTLPALLLQLLGLAGAAAAGATPAAEEARRKAAGQCSQRAGSLNTEALVGTDSAAVSLLQVASVALRATAPLGTGSGTEEADRGAAGSAGARLQEEGVGRLSQTLWENAWVRQEHGRALREHAVVLQKDARLRSEHQRLQHEQDRARQDVEQLERENARLHQALLEQEQQSAVSALVASGKGKVALVVVLSLLGSVLALTCGLFCVGYAFGHGIRAEHGMKDPLEEQFPKSVQKAKDLWPYVKMFGPIVGFAVGGFWFLWSIGAIQPFMKNALCILYVGAVIVAMLLMSSRDALAEFQKMHEQITTTIQKVNDLAHLNMAGDMMDTAKK